MEISELNGYVDKFYHGNTPNNVTIFFLEEKEYNRKYKELQKKINKICDSDYINTVGYFFYDNKDEHYYILIKKFGDLDCDNFYILNLFHELGHVETLPYRVGLQIDKAKKTKPYTVLGYNFWKEYIAQYKAVNKYEMYIGEIGFLFDKELAKKHISRLLNNFENNLYEIVLYCEITGIYIKGIKEELKELINVLKDTKNKFKDEDEVKNISLKSLNKIGKCVEKLQSKYLS